VTTPLSRTILAALKSRDEKRIHQEMLGVADEADDHVWSAIAFYQRGNGMHANLELAMAQRSIAILGEIIDRALKGGEDDAETD